MSLIFIIPVEGFSSPAIILMIVLLPAPEIKICTSKSILQDIARGKGPKNYLIALGCAGWEAGQLEQEIIKNSWLTVPANPKLIFSQSHSSKLTEAAGILGVNIRQLPQEAGHS